MLCSGRSALKASRAATPWPAAARASLKKAAGHVPGGVVAAAPVPPVVIAAVPAVETPPVPPVFAPAPRNSGSPAAAASAPEAAPAKPGFWASALARLRTAYPKKEI